MAWRSVGPQLGFDRLLAELVTQGEAIMTTRSRLRELLAVNRELTRQLDLPAVLQRIVEVGATLVGSRHAALVELGPHDGGAICRHGELDEEQVATIAARATVADVADETSSAHVRHVPAELRQGGTDRDPLDDPTTADFLVVPVMVHGCLFGELYLVESVDGVFSADDEELAEALADSAGIAIENARLYEESRHRERVAASLVKLSRQMSRADEGDPVDALLTEARQYFDVDMINVSLLDGERTHMYVDRVQGFAADTVTRTTFPVAGSPLREAMVANKDKVTYVEDISSELPHGFEELKDLGSFIGAPFVVERQTAGFLCLVRLVGRPQFTERDARTAEAFATQLSAVFERERARESERRLALLEDRERIARDLHDHVIQRLFAVGMNLGAVVNTVGAAAAEAIERQVDEVDEAIVQIRQSIFAIRASDRRAWADGLRARIVDIVERVSSRELRPTLTILGPVDSVISDDLAGEVLAVVSEGLTNALRHSGATSVDLLVDARYTQVRVDVADDGRGVPEGVPRRGLDNLKARAEAWGGTFEVVSSPAEGTRLIWTADARLHTPGDESVPEHAEQV